MSHAGAVLLVELADRTGLTGALSDALAATRSGARRTIRGGCSAMSR